MSGASLDQIMSHPGSRAWWRGSANLFNQTFGEFMNCRLAASRPQTDPPAATPDEPATGPGEAG